MLIKIPLCVACLFIGILFYYFEFPSLGFLVASGGCVGVLMQQRDPHLRGRRLIRFLKARELAARLTEGMKEVFRWAGIDWPPVIRKKGFFVLGEMGSGKTLFLYMILAQAIASRRARILIHDYKNNYPAILRHLDQENRIVHLNPYHKECSPFDIQAEMTSPDVAFDIAQAHIVERKTEGSGIYFTNGARMIVHGVLMYFYYRTQEVPNFTYKYADVINALYSKEMMRQMFSKHEDLKLKIQYLDRENDDILSTLQNDITPFRSAAALWQKSQKEPFSFQAWHKCSLGKIALLGGDPQHSYVMSILNRVLWSRAKSAMMQAYNGERPECWVFLDEFHAMGRLPKIEEFVTLCREYNVHLALATQNITQIRELYGNNITETIIQDLAAKAFLRCTGENAEWASKYLGDEEIIQRSDSDSINDRGPTWGTGRRPGPRRIVTPTEFGKLPLAKKSGMSGYFMNSLIDDVYYHQIPGDEFAHLWLPAGNEQQYPKENDGNKYILQPWSKDDLDRIGLKVSTPPPPKPRRRSGLHWNPKTQAL